MKPKDELDHMMDHIRKLERREQGLTGNGDEGADLAHVRAELRRLKLVRDRWVRRQFFSGWYPGCVFPRPEVA